MTAEEGEDSAAYTAANKAILLEAEKIARTFDPPARRLALLAWDAAPREDDDATKQFADLAMLAGFQVEWISTMRTNGAQTYR